MAKQYGLIIPGKEKPKLPTGIAKGNVFGSDSEDEGDEAKSTFGMGGTTTLKRQARIVQQKALEEDPTVYQYDEIYDEMESKKVDEEKIAEKKNRTSLYRKVIRVCIKEKIGARTQS
ncbi:nuclear speckle splicing regulatory protein 1-like [Ctenocephalides felis]|uniref:nuclear speckle splicing regulatory protein 1-like n=1 Tax=Ctenocephalides felis TaxID=7515 RepID=UPI000E6E39FA|nr:nuclear speckle splicing regulatory protein 1-like [Ctenocephalides felis]